MVEGSFLGPLMLPGAGGASLMGQSSYHPLARVTLCLDKIPAYDTKANMFCISVVD